MFVPVQVAAFNTHAQKARAASRSRTSFRNHRNTPDISFINRFYFLQLKQFRSKLPKLQQTDFPRSPGEKGGGGTKVKKGRGSRERRLGRTPCFLRQSHSRSGDNAEGRSEVWIESTPHGVIKPPAERGPPGSPRGRGRDGELGAGGGGLGLGLHLKKSFG